MQTGKDTGVCFVLETFDEAYLKCLSEFVGIFRGRRLNQWGLIVTDATSPVDYGLQEMDLTFLTIKQFNFLIKTVTKILTVQARNSRTICFA
jgi:hypothetical protein